jgi:hypothetical protein
MCQFTEMFGHFDCIFSAVQLDISESAKTLLRVFGFAVELTE